MAKLGHEASREGVCDRPTSLGQHSDLLEVDKEGTLIADLEGETQGDLDGHGLEVDWK